MDFPIVCANCHEVNLVDLEKLSRKPINETCWKLGFVCKCGDWVLVSIRNRLVDDKLARLKSMKVDKTFRYHFSKVFRRVLSLREQV